MELAGGRVDLQPFSLAALPALEPGPQQSDGGPGAAHAV